MKKPKIDADEKEVLNKTKCTILTDEAIIDGKVYAKGDVIFLDDDRIASLREGGVALTVEES